MSLDTVCNIEHLSSRDGWGPAFYRIGALHAPCTLSLGDHAPRRPAALRRPATARPQQAGQNPAMVGFSGVARLLYHGYYPVVHQGTEFFLAITKLSAVLVSLRGVGNVIRIHKHCLRCPGSSGPNHPES